MNVPRPALTTLSNCDQERIHSPGAIQPHGFMLVLEPGTWRVLGASTNVKEFFWREATSLVGLPVSSLVGESTVARLTQLQHEQAFTSRAILVQNISLKVGDRTIAVSLAAHRGGDFVFLEGEPAPDAAAVQPEEELQTFLGFFNEAGTLDEIFQLAVREVRRIAGFDRCLLYRFDPDWNGTVIAEDRNTHLPSYLNQRFPASDIPKPARDLYSKNRVRLIPTNTYRPVPISMLSEQKSGGSLDLTFSVLRSVSPIHLEYMRNMGTGSSMSVSILSAGQLWGLLSCHSLEPHLVPFATRAVCDLLGQFVSSQISTREHAADLALRVELAAISARLLQHLAHERTAPKNWPKDDVLALARSTGAALVSKSETTVYGLAPNEADVSQLAAHVLAQQNRLTFWDKIPVDLARSLSPDVPVSGMVGVGLSPDTVLLWFRPEIIQVIEWGGDPRKAIDKAGEGRSSLHPRTSFEVWRETVRGKSLPWERAIISAVREFQNVASGLIA